MSSKDKPIIVRRHFKPPSFTHIRLVNGKRVTKKVRTQLLNVHNIATRVKRKECDSIENDELMNPAAIDLNNLSRHPSNETNQHYSEAWKELQDPMLNPSMHSVLF